MWRTTGIRGSCSIAGTDRTNRSARDTRPNAPRLRGNRRGHTMTQPFVVDADSHVLEPPDLWENYLEPKYQSRGIHIKQTSDGEELIVDNEVIMRGRLAMLGGAE